MTTASSVSLTNSDLSRSLMKTSSSLVSLASGELSGSVMNTTSSAVSPTSGDSTSLTAASSGTTSVSKSLLEGGSGSRLAAAGAAAAPLAAGMTVGAVAAGVYGISNMVKYAKNEKSGAQAARDTVKGSAGVGVAAGLGTAASSAVAGTSLALGSTLVVPIAAGFAAAYATLKIWHKLFFK